jgi:hypothetical protein
LDDLRRSSLDSFNDDDLSFEDDFRGPSRRRRQVFPFEDSPILDELPGYGTVEKAPIAIKSNDQPPGRSGLREFPA